MTPRSGLPLKQHEKSSDRAPLARMLLSELRGLSPRRCFFRRSHNHRTEQLTCVVEAVQSSQEPPAACMPHFLLAFGDARRPPVGDVIIEAPSMFQARVTAVVRRVAPGVPFGEGLTPSAKMMMAIPPEEIGRMMSGAEAAELILQLVQGRGRPRS
jgi:hypothetical protein